MDTNATATTNTSTNIHVNGNIQRSIHIRIGLNTNVNISITVEIYGNPHELPTLVLYRKYRVIPAFPAGSDSVSLKDDRKQTQISRERVSQLIQVRCEVRILYLSRTTEVNRTCQSTHSSST